jgi:hypothetical protein
MAPDLAAGTISLVANGGVLDRVASALGSKESGLLSANGTLDAPPLPATQQKPWHRMEQNMAKLRN